MRLAVSIAALLILLIVSQSTQSLTLPQHSGLVVVEVRREGGEPQAIFQLMPSTATASTKPTVQLYLRDQRDVRDSAGQAVTGFGFYGWQSAGTAKVRVYLLVPAPGAPNRYLAAPGDVPDKLLRPVEWKTYEVRVGVAILMRDMETLGVKPMSLVALARGPG